MSIITIQTEERVQFLDIHLFGYKSEGESIIILFKTDSGKIVFSGVIDSFEDQGVNKTIDLLKTENIRSLNFLCWTHPDKDHTLGLNDIISNYVDKDTIILLPSPLFTRKDSLTDVAQTVKDKLKKLAKQNFNIKLVHENNFFINFSTGVPEDLLKCKISTLLPSSNLVLSQSDNLQLKTNVHCILLNFELNDCLNFTFCGDIEDDSIKYVVKIPEEISYFKIPHHGSSSSEGMLNFIKNNIEYGCCTNYVKHKLPDLGILNQYSNKCNEIFITGENDINKNSHSFGEVYVSFNLIDRTSTSQVNLNAKKY